MKLDNKLKIVTFLISLFLLASILPVKALLLPSDQQNINPPILNNFLNQDQQINKSLNQKSFNINFGSGFNYNDFLLNSGKYTQTFLSNPLWYGLYSVFKEVAVLIGQILIWLFSEATNIINFLLSKL